MLFLVLLALLQAPSAPLRTVAKGPMSGVEGARQVTVRTADEWSTLWSAHAPGTQPPAFDFSREMVVGVFLGSRPTGGYGVEIVKTMATDGGLLAEYVETAPPRDAITAQVLTAPYHLVAVLKINGDVKFQKIEK